MANTDSKKRWGASASLLVLGMGLGAAGTAVAQEAAAPADEAIVVTGFRASLRSAIDNKRTANVMMDAINAEDIADFPDANPPKPCSVCPASRSTVRTEKASRSRCAVSARISRASA